MSYKASSSSFKVPGPINENSKNNNSYNELLYSSNMSSKRTSDSGSKSDRSIASQSEYIKELAKDFEDYISEREAKQSASKNSFKNKFSTEQSSTMNELLKTKVAATLKIALPDNIGNAKLLKLLKGALNKLNKAETDKKKTPLTLIGSIECEGLSDVSSEANGDDKSSENSLESRSNSDISEIFVNKEKKHSKAKDQLGKVPQERASEFYGQVEQDFQTNENVNDNQQKLSLDPIKVTDFEDQFPQGDSFYKDSEQVRITNIKPNDNPVSKKGNSRIIIEYDDPPQILFDFIKGGNQNSKAAMKSQDTSTIKNFPIVLSQHEPSGKKTTKHNGFCKDSLNEDNEHKQQTKDESNELLPADGKENKKHHSNGSNFLYKASSNKVSTIPEKTDNLGNSSSYKGSFEASGNSFGMVPETEIQNKKNASFQSQINTKIFNDDATDKTAHIKKLSGQDNFSIISNMEQDHIDEGETAFGNDDDLEDMLTKAKARFKCLASKYELNKQKQNKAELKINRLIKNNNFLKEQVVLQDHTLQLLETRLHNEMNGCKKNPQSNKFNYSSINNSTNPVNTTAVTKGYDAAISTLNGLLQDLELQKDIASKHARVES